MPGRWSILAVLFAVRATMGFQFQAVAALAPLPDPGIDETLGTIAHDDPDQNVRFEAAKSAYKRAETQRTKRSD